MYRFAEKDLKDWFYKKGRMPLIIRGARQTGKSTLVRNFAKNAGLELLEINLEKGPLLEAESDSFDLSKLLDEIQLKYRVQLHSKSLIFFDEIQEQPKLLKRLRYFYEERPEIAIVSAGSWLEIAFRDENFSFPVGRVEFYHLGPMSFNEFLLAVGDSHLLEKLDQASFSEVIVDLAKRRLREFLYIGGMPKAVSTFISDKSLVGVREVQEQVLQTYLADFPKYNSRIQMNRVRQVFERSVVEIGKKLIYQRLDPDSKSRDIHKVVDLLIEARVLIACVHSNGNTVPLGGESSLNTKKLYFLDVGLMNALLKTPLEVIDAELRFESNAKGAMIEQYVAQHLQFIAGHRNDPSLYYWLRDLGSQKSEVDFLIQNGKDIVPLEVKSNSAGHLRSLFYFTKEKGSKQAVRCSMRGFGKRQESHIIHGKPIELTLIDLPLYAIENIVPLVFG